MKPELTARAAALLTVGLKNAFDRELHRTTTRFRISMKTFRRIADSPIPDEVFFKNYVGALARLGYSAFPYADYVAIIDSDAVEGWPRISADRISEMVDSVADGDDVAIKTLEEEARSASNTTRARVRRRSKSS